MPIRTSRRKSSHVSPASCLLDRLESRVLLAAATWDGGGGDGLWSNPLNWNRLGADVVPQDGDDVTINVGANPTVNFSAAAGTVSLNSLSTNENLVVSGGSLSVANAFSVNSSGFTYEGGVLAGSPILTNSILTLPGSGLSPLTFLMRGSSSLTGAVAPGQVVHAQGINGLSASLTLEDGVANHGTIRLASSTSLAAATNMIIAGAFTNEPDGTLESLVGTGGGSRTITGGFTNLGTISYDTPTTLSGTGAVLSHNAGAITGTGSFQVSGATTSFIWNGGAIDPAGTAALVNGALSIPAGSTGSGLIVLRGATTLSGIVTPTQTVQVQGINGQNSTLTAADGVINHGTVRLASNTSLGSFSNLVFAGLFDNAVDGTIEALVGTGGGNRSISGGHLRNSGTLTAEAGVSLPVTGIYEIAGGTISGKGDAYLSNTELRVTSSPDEPSPVILRGTSTLTTDNLPNVIIHVQGINGRTATLTASDGVSNHGTIRLASNTSLSVSSNLTLAGAFTNAADGTIESLFGTGGGARGITGGLTNLGTINVESLTILSGAGAALHLVGGSVSGAGSLQVNGATASIIWTGGTADPSGTLVLASGALSIPSGSTGSGLVIARGSSALSGIVTTAQTVHVQGINGQVATMTVADGTINHGTVRLASNTSLATPSNLSLAGVFINAADGTIEALVGTGGGGRSIAGHLRNSGVLTAEKGVSLPLTGIYEVAGGVITGGGDTFVSNSEVRVTASPAKSTTVIARGSSTLTTDNLPNVVVHVQGTNAAGHATLTLADGTANHGTIRMASITTIGLTSNLAIAGAFTNAADGTIESLPGTGGGGRNIAGGFTNLGTIFAETFTSLTGANAVFNHNAGTITGPGSFQLSGATATFVWNGGTTDPTGTVVVLSANLSIPIGSTGSGLLMVRGAVMFDGAVAGTQTLHVQGNNATGHGILTVADGASNHGVIRLASNTTIGLASSIVIPGVFTNAAGGTIEALVGTGGGARNITGHFRNSGVLTAEAGVVVPLVGIYEIAGGSIEGQGDVFVSSSEVRVTASPAATTVVVVRGNSTLTTDNLPNVVLHVQGTNAAGNATLTIADGAANHGVIRMASDTTIARTSNLTLEGAFTNAAGGTIEPLVGTGGGGRTIAGTLTNAGTISVPPGVVLQITGELNQTSTGNLAFVVDQPGVAGRINVTGTATLGGQLTMTFVNQFVPECLQSFTFLTATTQVGEFDSVSTPAPPTGLQFVTLYTGNQTRVVASSIADANRDGIVNSADFFYFLNFFFDNNADFNGDGVTNSQDFFSFLNAFFNACG